MVKTELKIETSFVVCKQEGTEYKFLRGVENIPVWLYGVYEKFGNYTMFSILKMLYDETNGYTEMIVFDGSMLCKYTLNTTDVAIADRDNITNWELTILE